MKKAKIEINIENYPQEFHYYLKNSEIFDSSCSKDAKVIFIKEHNCFLKCAPKNTLKNEALIDNYFYKKGLSSKVIDYVSDEQDWLLTEAVKGADCTHYLDNPDKLCDTIAEILINLHSLDFSDCPIKNRTENYLETAHSNFRKRVYDTSLFPDNWGYFSAEEAYSVIIKNQSLLKSDTLIHGDYCLPNILLKNFKFSGFVDLGNGGVGDKHIDIFWGAWTLNFNLNTEKYTERFFDAYGKNNFDKDILKLVAACEVFG